MGHRRVKRAPGQLAARRLAASSCPQSLLGRSPEPGVLTMRGVLASRLNELAATLRSGSAMGSSSASHVIGSVHVYTMTISAHKIK